jgi:hypothetical protein
MDLPRFCRPNPTTRGRQLPIQRAPGLVNVSIPITVAYQHGVWALNFAQFPFKELCMHGTVFVGFFGVAFLFYPDRGAAGLSFQGF